MKRIVTLALLCLAPLILLQRPAYADRTELMPLMSASIARAATEAEELGSCLAGLDKGGASALPLLVEEWQRRRALWIGTLWATGFSEKEIAILTARLDAVILPPVARRDTSCIDPIAQLDVYLNRHPPIDASAIAARGISWGEVIIDTPDSTERIEAAVSPRLKRWAELLACAHTLETDPPIWVEWLSISEGAWALEAHRLRIFLQQKGLPRPKVNRVLARIILQVRWNRPQITPDFCRTLDVDEAKRWGGAVATMELSNTVAALLGLRPPP